MPCSHGYCIFTFSPRDELQHSPLGDDPAQRYLLKSNPACFSHRCRPTDCTGTACIRQAGFGSFDARCTKSAAGRVHWWKVKWEAFKNLRWAFNQIYEQISKQLTLQRYTDCVQWQQNHVTHCGRYSVFHRMKAAGSKSKGVGSNI